MRKGTQSGWRFRQREEQRHKSSGRFTKRGFLGPRDVVDEGDAAILEGVVPRMLAQFDEGSHRPECQCFRCRRR